MLRSIRFCKLVKESGIKRKGDHLLLTEPIESVLGKSLSENSSSVSLSPNTLVLKIVLLPYLLLLREALKKLYGYLVHHFEFYQSSSCNYGKNERSQSRGKDR